MYCRKDNWDIAHEWANRGENGGAASSGNLFYSNGCIYSYGDHFMIAKHVWNDKREHAVVFTERTYSRTTSKQVAIVRSASSHLEMLFVADPALTAEEIFERWYSKIKGIAGCINQARKPAKYLLDIQQVFSQAKRYADFFGYNMPELLLKAGGIENFEQYAGLLKMEQGLRKKQAKKEQAERLKIQKINLKRWRAFQINRIDLADGFDYLRFNAEKGSIETTQRIDFLLSAGHQLYELIKEVNAKGGCTLCKEMFLGRYPIIAINTAFIRIGCHKVALKEINRFANSQGWQ